MEGTRRLWRRRALMLAAAATTAAAGTVATSSLLTSRAGAAPAAQAAPNVDMNYLYGQLFFMGTNYSYRISGADGPPQDPSNPFNVPPTVNGWQELYAHFKSELTSTASNGPLASFATVSDHYFRRTGGYQFDSDDAEVTIPGATCPGQRVLLTSHPDETPVPTDIVSEINTGSTSGVTGFNAARREITDSNLGNEGAYDGLSGVAVTLGEYNALLHWYENNGTYPKRTLKVTLLDASRGHLGNGLFSREGSNYYAQNLIPDGPQGQTVLLANMDSLGLDYPAFHLGTQHFWNNIVNGGVGPWNTFIKATPAAPNSAYPDTGAGSPGAAITGNSAAISQLHTDLQNAVTAGFQEQGAKYNFATPAENPLDFNNNNGQSPTGFTGSVPQVPTYSTADQAQYSSVRDDTDALEDEQAFFNKGIPGFTVSGVKNSTIDENPYPSTVSANIRSTPIIGYAGNQTTFQLGGSTPAAGMTTTAAASNAGDTNVKVASVTNLAVGNAVFIDNGANIEYDQITAIGTAGATGTGVTLATPLTAAHASGVPFNINQVQPVGFTADTIDHLNYFAGGAPHGPGGRSAPTEELKRALELPAEWTSMLIANDDYAGATAAPTSPVAYFETSPVKPASTTTVSFDASFARAADGSTDGLTYYWDFGDGTHATGRTVSHTFSGPTWADVKLAVGKSGSWGLYRQALAVDSPSGSAPSTPACGTFSPDEAAALIAAASGGGTPAKSEGVER
jgi:hypothetical protein